jgi:hypothetical protein
MSARRCSLCGINFPTITQFITCPLHEEPNSLHSDIEPDEDWKVNFERLVKYTKGTQDIRKSIPLVHDAAVTTVDGRLHVAQGDLQRGGLRLWTGPSGDDFDAQFHLFELDDGWVYETQGYDESRRQWWVERVIEVMPAPG